MSDKDLSKSVELSEYTKELLKKYKRWEKPSPELIRNLRLDHGYTQDELAFKLDITKPYISMMENGKVRMTLDNFLRMLTVLGLKNKV